MCVCWERGFAAGWEVAVRHKTKENAFALKKKKEDEHGFLVQVKTEWNCAFM